jgi:hypothetical protein
MTLTPENQPQPEGSAASKSMGSSGFLMIGAGLIVAGWVLFGLLIGEYAFSAVYVALAVLVLLSVLGMGGFGVGTGTQRTIGLFIGIAALLDIFNDLRFSGFPDGFVDVLAYLVFVAGAALMFVGARGIKSN